MAGAPIILNLPDLTVTDPITSPTDDTALSTSQDQTILATEAVDVFSDVDICSDSLFRLGANGISSLTEDTDEGRLCARVYPKVKSNLLTCYKWKFTAKKIQLSRLTAAPESAWLYKFTLPPDRISDNFFAVFDSDSSGSAPFKEFEIMGDVLYTDVQQLWVDYQHNAREETWPGYFVELTTLALCEALALNITESLDKADYYRREKEVQLRKAKLINSKQHKVRPLRDFSLINARYQGVR